MASNLLAMASIALQPAMASNLLASTSYRPPTQTTRKHKIRILYKIQNHKMICRSELITTWHIVLIHVRSKKSVPSGKNVKTHTTSTPPKNGCSKSSHALPTKSWPTWALQILLVSPTDPTWKTQSLASPGLQEMVKFSSLGSMMPMLLERRTTAKRWAPPAVPKLSRVGSGGGGSLTCSALLRSLEYL